MNQKSDMLDEKIIKEEYERIKVSREADRDEEIRKRILEKEKNQKSVSLFFEEIANGSTELNGVSYLTEKRSCFEERVNLALFSEDIELLNESEQMLSVCFKQAEFSINIFYSKDPLDQFTQKEYVKRMSEQAKQQKLQLVPVENGELVSQQQKIYYNSVIMDTAAATLFILNFHCVRKHDGILGNFTCQLRNRFPYENLFKATIEHFYVCEEDD